MEKACRASQQKEENRPARGDSLPTLDQDDVTKLLKGSQLGSRLRRQIRDQDVTRPSGDEDTDDTTDDDSNNDSDADSDYIANDSDVDDIQFDSDKILRPRGRAGRHSCRCSRTTTC